MNKEIDKTHQWIDCQTGKQRKNNRLIKGEIDKQIKCEKEE